MAQSQRCTFCVALSDNAGREKLRQRLQPIRRAAHGKRDRAMCFLARSLFILGSALIGGLRIAAAEERQEEQRKQVRGRPDLGL
jgi:hypothetical protein